MKVGIEFVEKVLGTASADAKLHHDHVAGKSADAEKIEQEMAALPVEELFEKAVTVFPRGEDGEAILYDYQVKGFFKEAIGVLLEFVEPDGKIGKAKLSKWTVKRIVDNCLQVYPRQIPLVLPAGGEIELCTRPLRAQTMQGERVALATSETVPAGTRIEIEVEVLNDQLMPYVVKALDYGHRKGIGQWRNAGHGRFVWEERA